MGVFHHKRRPLVLSPFSLDLGVCMSRLAAVVLKAFHQKNTHSTTSMHLYMCRKYTVYGKKLAVMSSWAWVV